jgi:putative sterol carrier protein
MGIAQEKLSESIEKINSSPKARAVFVTNVAGKDVDWEMSFQFNLEGEEPFYVQVANQNATINTGNLDNPDIIMSGDPQSIVKICEGQGDFTHAISREEITVEKGKVMDVIRLTRAITTSMRKQ